MIINNKREKTGEEKDEEKTNNTFVKPLPIPKITLPASERVYANIIHIVTLIVSIAALFVPIFVLANPSNNVLDPNIIFGKIFEGATPEQIWAASFTGEFPGVHFYINHFFKTDSWAMLTVNIGCAVGLLAVVPAVLIQYFREKHYFKALLGTVMAALIICALTGVC